MNLLAEVIRGRLVESRHYGFICMANSAGEVLLSSGPLSQDPLSFLRSAAKPIQAVPLVESGAADFFRLTEEELALACASHNGEPEHVRMVEHMLAKAGLEAGFLLCGADYPLHDLSRETLIKAGEAPQAKFNNCSGKHAGMLMVCKHQGWPLENYTSLEHPLQQAIIQVVAEFCGLEVEQIHTGVDGCSVVCFGMTTVQMATAFARLADPVYWEKKGVSQRAETVQRITAAMRKNPFYVAGTGRGDTDLMNSFSGSKIFSKVGAEAVWGLGLPEQGLGVALKVADGASRASAVIMSEFLRQTGYVPAEDLSHFDDLQVKVIVNKRGIPVGEYRPAFELRPPNEWE
jgi:L-asparaginase II